MFEPRFGSNYVQIKPTLYSGKRSTLLQIFCEKCSDGIESIFYFGRDVDRLVLNVDEIWVVDVVDHWHCNRLVRLLKIRKKKFQVVCITEVEEKWKRVVNLNCFEITSFNRNEFLLWLKHFFETDRNHAIYCMSMSPSHVKSTLAHFSSTIQYPWTSLLYVSNLKCQRNIMNQIWYNISSTLDLRTQNNQSTIIDLHLIQSCLNQQLIIISYRTLFEISNLNQSYNPH